MLLGDIVGNRGEKVEILLDLSSNFLRRQQGSPGCRQLDPQREAFHQLADVSRRLPGLLRAGLISQYLPAGRVGENSRSALACSIACSRRG